MMHYDAPGPIREDLPIFVLAIAPYLLIRHTQRGTSIVIEPIGPPTQTILKPSSLHQASSLDPSLSTLEQVLVSIEVDEHELNPTRPPSSSIPREPMHPVLDLSHSNSCRSAVHLVSPSLAPLAVDELLQDLALQKASSIPLALVDIDLNPDRLLPKDPTLPLGLRHQSLRMTCGRPLLNTDE